MSVVTLETLEDKLKNVFFGNEVIYVSELLSNDCLLLSEVSINNNESQSQNKLHIPRKKKRTNGGNAQKSTKINKKFVKGSNELANEWKQLGTSFNRENGAP